MNGGYEDGYKACPCFWGRQPGSLIQRLVKLVGDFDGLLVLDAGCGEGKNAAFLAGHKATVRAFDISEAALQNARRTWHSSEHLHFEHTDVRSAALGIDQYDVVIAYGLFHCLRSNEEIHNVVQKLRVATRQGGYNVICTFNNRHQELHAHPGFSPTLLTHATYLALYHDWDVVFASDEDLHETHPHNNVPHRHSMTRMITRRKA